MSRIGKMPIEIPAGVDVSVADGVVTVKKGNQSLTQSISPLVAVNVNDGVLTVERLKDDRFGRSMHGLTRSLINNMIIGLEKGFSKNLEITGVGYNAAKEGSTLVLNVGYSHQVRIDEPEGITFDVPANNKITVSGIDKQLVGEMAAKIRAVRLPDAYKGKGIRYEGEILRLKVGKTGAK